jgi:hypothetical protein
MHCQEISFVCYCFIPNIIKAAAHGGADTLTVNVESDPKSIVLAEPLILIVMSI